MAALYMHVQWNLSIVRGASLGHMILEKSPQTWHLGRPNASNLTHSNYSTAVETICFVLCSVATCASLNYLLCTLMCNLSKGYVHSVGCDV